jgi:hypothetical protein
VRLARNLVPALAACLLPVVGAACGDEPSAEERRAALVDDLAEDLRAETDGALDEETATCVAEALADAVGVDRFDEVVDAAADGGDPELRQQVIDVFASCEALEPILDGS